MAVRRRTKRWPGEPLSRLSRSLTPVINASGAGDLASNSGLAVLHLCGVDACVLRGASERVALLDRYLVVRVALIRARFLAGFDLLRRGVLARIDRDTVDLGIGLGADERSFRFLDADILAVAGEVIAFFDADVVGRLGVRDARAFASLRRVRV